MPGFRVRLDLPGDLVEHNADRIEDGTLVWDLELTSAEPQRLFARTVGGQRVGPAETGSAGPGTEPGDGLQALVGPLGRGLSFTAVALASLLTLFRLPEASRRGEVVPALLPGPESCGRNREARSRIGIVSRGDQDSPRHEPSPVPPAWCRDCERWEIRFDPAGLRQASATRCITSLAG